MGKEKPYRYLLYLLLLVLEWLSNHLPRRFVLGLVSIAGRVAWLILPKERRKVLSHLKLAFGTTKTDEELIRIGKAVFPHFGYIAVDTLRIPLYKKKHLKDQIIKADPDVFQKIEEALSKKRGLIFLTGHIGNWELITFYIGERGYQGTVIGRRIYYEPFNRVLEKIRLACGVKVFYRDDSTKEILRVLKENKALGVLPDQDVDSIDGIFVDFFGIPAYTPSGPAKFSIVSGAPILPVFMVREGDHYHLMADKIIWPEVKTTKDEAIIEITKKWSQVIESMVRKYPEQWVWMHRRWKTRPQNEQNQIVSKYHG